MKRVARVTLFVEMKEEDAVPATMMNICKDICRFVEEQFDRACDTSAITPIDPKA